ncbi:MAG: DNA gyrase subunit A [Candidatus Micrarchaeota archaeon]|nr:DNA gyrase subunit A [Candidatus Micrarchaeota archaeon]MDE1824265.1 DNA gyrase subunit A [Candidatus Micrarchaeota archaeon]MDE1849229.1 DNA gyrase subunit A [Candidatus Micrarchaeota archaeon]
MSGIENISLEDELQNSYIDYAMSVIIGRAIPEARDGLKPVQRRILYAMHLLKNLHNQPTKKSARIVGEVIGKFHPHGDTAIYDALARMAQSFSMNHLLVEGQGNFGSIDGDPPAAMRYTEVRLTKLSEEMLGDIEKDTVDLFPNFDNTEKEPYLLPSKVPNLLVNGATGIAVGVATSMPPHNLSEVCDAIIHVLDNPEPKMDDILGIIKGPDFPTGGIALMSQGAYNGYRYGRGQLTLKARVKIDKKRITIDQIPYNVNKSALIQHMADLAKDKKIVGIKDIRDESDKSGISIVVELRDEDAGEQVLNMLYKYTQLQTTMPIINLAIVGKSLKNLNVLQLITTFINHRREIVLRRTKYDLEIARSRLHIVEGLLIAISDIGNVIDMIKASREVSEARKRLMENYKLSDKQANAILDMKLSRLTHLENDSLEKEKKALAKDIGEYSAIIADASKVDKIIKEETIEVKKEFGRPRKTEIIQTEEIGDIEDEDMISNDMVTIIFTNNGYVKRLGVDSYKEQARGGKGLISINLKEGDYVKQILTCHNKDFIICITDQGRAYWLKAYRIPEGTRYSEGKAIVNLLGTEEKIVKLLHIKDFDGSKIVFLTARGLAKKLTAKLFSKPRASGVRAITLVQNDQIVDSIVCKDQKYLIITTVKGKAVKFDEGLLRPIGRAGMGVRGIRISGNDAARNIIAASETGSILTITSNGYGKITGINMYRTQGRGGKGVINLKANQKTGDVTKSLFVSNEDKVVLINSKGVSITFPLSSVRVTGRAASGVRLMKLEQGAKVEDAMLMKEEA